MEKELNEQVVTTENEAEANGMEVSSAVAVAVCGAAVVGVIGLGKLAYDKVLKPGWNKLANTIKEHKAKKQVMAGSEE